ncbi:hypothetical protein SMACR_07151 [Sordaria macrospora]|uniref:WGS project CABT00000000 data, contig 2.40 n=2 Tax=Sordaria macrospora TaxID=5147 RepID=F7W7N5_SORMK|nr:uncharacterized protein SMAC_07151 [Sordaria macrospora k-hell]KAA8631733.1 hypothetical protein SMACR_07151 [Sordaria macrospora]WPJ61222.1 hypothetical protein SMAC4_07151 [Sordaria macrospora]CCC13527.1 unnamed protein product [Sordaria macrospora k-hell]
MLPSVPFTCIPPFQLSTSQHKDIHRNPTTFAMNLHPHQPHKPPMASPIDLDKYEMPNIEHSGDSDDAYSIVTTPVSGSEYAGGDDDDEILLSNEFLPSAAPAAVLESHAVAETHADPREDTRGTNRRREQKIDRFLLFLRIIMNAWCLLDLWQGRNHTTSHISSGLSENMTQPNTTQIPLCGPSKPYQPYHLLPAYSQTPYGILDCNHDATHDELLQSFFDKSTATTLVHFYNGGPESPDDMDCLSWKRPVHEDIQVLRDTAALGLNNPMPEEWAIQWLFLQEDRLVADAMILPYFGIVGTEMVWCHDDEVSRRQRYDQYNAQMLKVVGPEIARKTQLEIRELEDKRKSEEEETRVKSSDV